MQTRDFARIERAPAYRLVYDAVEREIFAGNLKVGDPLPAETQLADQFGLNRSTVREGIRLLEQSGLVVREGGKRPRIAIPHYLELASSASRALVLASITFRELWEASVLVEPMMAEVAARNIGEADLKRLAVNIAAMDKLIAPLEARESVDVDGFVELDTEFHEIMAQASGNRVLILSHEPVTKLFIPAGRIILPRLGTYRRVLDAHRFLYERLAAHDPDGARTWMRRHMNDFRKGYEMTGSDLDSSLDAGRLGLT
jgi:GntR family transcriptional regulator, transcriptional repressor for pyruvate dehydrogenase complex